MEDSLGWYLFLENCLSKREFKTFIGLIDRELRDKKRLEDVLRSWTRFYSDNTPESQEAYRYLEEKFPQHFITFTSDHDGCGPFLDIVGFGLIRTIQGLEQIKQYSDKLASYAKGVSIA